MARAIKPYGSSLGPEKRTRCVPSWVISGDSHTKAKRGILNRSASRCAPAANCRSFPRNALVNPSSLGSGGKSPTITNAPPRFKNFTKRWVLPSRCRIEPPFKWGSKAWYLRV